MKKAILGIVVFGFLAYLAIGQVGNARRPAIISGADRLVQLQRADLGWEGTWYWYIGSTYNATNLTGVTALGLLEAFRDIKDQAYLDSALAAAGFIQAHLGIGATDTQYHVRATAPDIVFLHRLSEVTGEEGYKDRAILEWNNIKGTYPTAASLDTLFRSINRRSAWDFAFFLEAAHLSGDSAWADAAAAIIASTGDPFYYGEDTFWFALNLSASIRALVGCGYYAQYSGAVNSLLYSLIGIMDKDNAIDGWVQDTAYAILAFNTVGGGARAYSNDLGRWLSRKLTADACGGWIEGGLEYPEVDGEAVRALGATIGSNVTLDGFEPGSYKSSSWRKALGGKTAKPFLEGFEY